MSQSTSVAAPTRDTARPLSQCRTLQEVFGSAEFEKRIVQALPSHMKAGTIMRSFIQATSRQPDLLRCDLRQAIGGFLTLAELGLPLTPTLGMAHLIPFNSRRKNRQTGRWEDFVTLTIIIGYQGLIELAMRSGMVGGIHAEVVLPSDDFRFKMGTQQFLDHTPKYADPEGTTPTHAWAIAHLRGETMPPFEVYPWRKVLGIRDRSQGFLRAKSAFEDAKREGKEIPRTWTEAPWVRDIEAMGKKTMIRALSKYLPKSAELQGGLSIDEPERGFVDFGPVIDGERVTEGGLPIEGDEVDPATAFGVRDSITAAPPAATAAPPPPNQPTTTATAAPPPAEPPKQRGRPRKDAAPPPPAAEDEPPPPSEDAYGEPVEQTEEEVRQIKNTLAREQAPPDSTPAPPSDFEAYVIDEVGEAVTDLHTDPVEWAHALRLVYDTASPESRNQIVENNMDALAAARPFAAETLRDVMMRKAETPKLPPVEIVAVVVPKGRSGNPDWIAYVKAVRDVLPRLGTEIPAGPWVLAQVATLGTCPQAQRLNLIKDITARLDEFGQKPPQELAALVNAPLVAAVPKKTQAEVDSEWIENRKSDFSSCKTAFEVEAMAGRPSWKERINEIKERNPGLVAELRAYGERLMKELPKDGARP